MKYIFTILIIPFIYLSCNSGSKDIPVLNFASALRHPEEFNLADYIDSIEYISLETNKECLLGGGYVVMSSNYFYYYTLPYYNGQIYQFTRSGKYVQLIGKLGHGPEEYSELFRCVLSPNGQFIYACSRYNILKYDTLGHFVQSFKLSKGKTKVPPMIITCRNQFIFRIPEKAFDGDAIIVCDSNFNVIHSFKRKVVRKEKGVVPIDEWLSYDGKYTYFKEPLCDTLYRIDENLICEPFLVFDLGGERPDNTSFDSYKQLGGKRYFARVFMNGELIYSNTINAFPHAGKAADFLYFIRTGRLIHLSPNKPLMEIDGINWHIVGNTGKYLIFKADLVSLLNNRDKLRDTKLKQIAATLDENSNPVLAVVKVKI